jgi:diguanylate cyclase (GGDEF)-like protein
MQAPQTPDNEDERLRTLRSLDILDTPQEERFDTITRLAQQFFNVPIAVVSLIDENRQWFKSCIGLPVDETERTISFCGHTILSDQALVISDALEDERFSDNPLVTGPPHIRFYAGYPISTPNGDKMGTLCIIDVKPHALTGDQISVLKDFAGLVERELVVSYVATVDELTSVSNRRGFMVAAQRELSRCARQNQSASLIFFNLNNFKSINDRYGHEEGDKALVDFVKMIKTMLRGTDIFGRLGGDEFVALLGNATEQQASEVLNRYQWMIEKHNSTLDKNYTLSFSYGLVSLNPDRHDLIETVLLEADSLMYLQKKANYS